MHSCSVISYVFPMTLVIICLFTDYLGLLCPHLCSGAQRVRVGVAPTPTDNEGSQTMTTSSTDDSSQSMFGESRLKRSAKNDKKGNIIASVNDTDMTKQSKTNIN